MSLNFEKIEKGKGTIYHELGHLFSYSLANKSQLTYLGEVKKFAVGFQENCVVPAERIYHFENVSKQKEEILENTSNINRTIAWFIEVLSGCVFQSLYEGTDFEKCLENNGKIDSDNLMVLRSFSSFRWTYDDILDLQQEYSNFVKKNNIINNLEFIVSEFVTLLKTNVNHQVVLIDNKLNEVTLKINHIITDSLLKEYLDLIAKFNSKFELARK